MMLCVSHQLIAEREIGDDICLCGSDQKTDQIEDDVFNFPLRDD